MGSVLTGIAGNVVKAIDAGQRIAKRRQKRYQRDSKRTSTMSKKRKVKSTGAMTGRGRKRKSIGRRRPSTVRIRKRRRKRRTQKGIKTRKVKRFVTRGQKGNGVGRPRRRRRVIRI